MCVEVVTDDAKRALYIVSKFHFIWRLAYSSCMRTENQKVDIFRNDKSSAFIVVIVTSFRFGGVCLVSLLFLIPPVWVVF